jgi:hypothetical protein
MRDSMSAEVKHAVGNRIGLHLHACNHGGGCQFVVQDVAFGVYQDRVAGLRPHLDGDFVCHRARRGEQRGFVPQQFRHTSLQAVDRRVFAVHIVAEFGVCHRAAHLRRRQGHSIRTQVYTHGQESIPALGVR